ncbi:hypothetical protein BD769DRAFT_1658254 [Suillus cothurnatus]|nr:hypothetical protein BD769DRAFT_1658254 [Suillus cothurnatus]
MSASPPPKRLRQYVRVETHVTPGFQHSSLHIQISSDSDELRDTDCKQFLQINEVVSRETLAADKNEEPKGEVESELRSVKERLENAENMIAYLSERVNTYRYRWLEEYYRADNLERHMPCDVNIPELGQIPEGLASPAFFPEFFTWNEEASERGDVELLERQGNGDRTTPGDGEDYGDRE